MHPLDLSPRANSSRSTIFSSKNSARNVEHNHKNTFRKATNKLGNKRDQDQGKRGRPRADILTTLMVEGSSSRSKIRCIKCGRAFPREKSLQAHMRTHTGEKPYECDFPECSKAFCQSGQLKTHQRLHTGEKPFACVVEGCESRFTHANRHCSTHPYAGLKRLEINLSQVAKLNEGQTNPDVKKWIEKYLKQSKERLNSKLSVKRSFVHESHSSKQIQPITPVKVPVQNAFSSQNKAESPPIKFQATQDEKMSPLDLTRNKRSPALPRLSPISPPTTSVHGPPPPLIPIVPSMSTPVPLALTVQNSSHITSLTSSSQLNSSSLLPLPLPNACSSLSTTSPTITSVPTVYRHHLSNFPLSERKDEFYPYVFSSQMVLQGHTNFGGSCYSHCYSLPVGYTPTSSSIPEPSNTGMKSKEKEKDRYISALALIELSKG